uniref:TTC3 protein n=1 Tax=Fopius arisanus TaxID=64838 RepID=A0A0C9PWQ7_9HYME
MATEKIKFDTSSMYAVNANIIKCLDGIKAANLLSKSLTPEERRHLARATEEYTNGHLNAAMVRYKSYMTLKRKLPVNNNEHSRLDVIVQYLVCKCLLQSNRFQDLNEARSMLTDLEASFGRIYPMIYLGLSQFYVKVFCFGEADKMATKGLSVVEGSDFPVCYLPESKIAILESTTDELTRELTSLKEQCSGWHPPDAKCFMTICKQISPNHLCGRDIFVKSPAYNGMVTITCSNATNPCEIHFHCVCWKVRKALSVVKISDKEVLLNWECFTPNCGSEDEPSLIRKITIHKEDGSMKDIEPTLDKSQWHAQQAAPKITTRKQKQLIKSTMKIPRMRPPMTNDKISYDALHASNSVQRMEEIIEGAENTRELFESRLLEIMTLREMNFTIDPDNDWRPNKAFYGNEHIQITIDSCYEPDFSKDSENVSRIKSFLFSYFLSYIESKGPIKNDHLMEQWRSLTESSELQPILKEFNGIVDVRNFLLQSLKFVAVGNYISIPALLPGTYELVEGEAELKVKEMMEKKTFDFSNGHLKRRKKTEVEVKPEDNPVAGSSAQVAESDPFLLIADNLCDDVEDGKSGNDDCSTTVLTEDCLESQLSFQTPVKKLRVQEKKNLEEVRGEEKSDVEEKNEVKKDYEEIEGIKRLEEDEEDEKVTVEQAPVVNPVKDMIPPPPAVTTKKLAKQEKKKRQKEFKLQVNTQKIKKTPQMTGKKKGPQVPKKMTERYVLETESEGTLDDQDELPWDSRPVVQANAQSCITCETCPCDKIPKYEATILELEKELQSTREELRRSAERVMMSEAENQKNLAELKSTKTRLLQLDEELMKTRDNLKTSMKDLKTEQQKFKEIKRKMSKDILNSEFNYNNSVITSKIDMTQSQYAIVAKLQNLVHQTTNTYLAANGTEWTVPLEKLEKLRRDLETELKNLIKNDNLSEETAFKSHMNALHLLNLPQRNIPDLIEIAFNMLKVHFQQVMVSYRGMAPSGFTQGPPIIPLWYQQPRFTPPSLPCGPYHPLPTPMMPSGQFHQPGFARHSYPRQNFQRESYSQYVNSPMTIIEVETAAALPASERNKKELPELRESSDSESSEDRSERSQASKKLQDNPCSWKDVDPGILAAVTSGDKLLDVNISDDSQIQAPAVGLPDGKVPKTYVQIPSPVPMIPTNFTSAETISKTPVPATAQNPSPVVAPVVSVVQFVKPIEEKSQIPVSSLQLLASSVSAPLTANVAPKIVSETARDPNLVMPPPIVPSTALVASSPLSVDKRVKSEENITSFILGIPSVSPVHQAPQNVPKTPPAKKSLAAMGITANQAEESLNIPVKAELIKPSVPSGLSKYSNTSRPMGNNQEPVTELGEVKKPKMQSMDKLMHILRNKHPGVLEFDLMWSVSSVRNTHNNSLTGLPLVQIIAEADKLICARQKMQLINYSSSNKVVNQMNPGNNLINPAGRIASDGSSSSLSVSSFNRGAFARKNPWCKPQDVTWTKESPESECVICCETLMTGMNQPTYTLKCQHTFHKQCLLEWFNQSRSCPTCRIHSTIDDDFPPLP